MTQIRIRIRKHRLPYGPTHVFKTRYVPKRGHVGYLQASTYIKQPTTVWSVTHLPGTRHEHADHFLNPDHAVRWLKENLKKHDQLDNGTWRVIADAAPDMLPTFRTITGLDWRPDATQHELF